MVAYLIRRIIGLVIVFLIVSVLAFLLMHSVPGGPFDEEPRAMAAQGMGEAMFTCIREAMQAAGPELSA